MCKNVYKMPLKRNSDKEVYLKMRGLATIVLSLLFRLLVRF